MAVKAVTNKAVASMDVQELLDGADQLTAQRKQNAADIAELRENIARAQERLNGLVAIQIKIDGAIEFSNNLIARFEQRAQPAAAETVPPADAMAAQL